jgi:CBS domain-containing protein
MSLPVGRRQVGACALVAIVPRIAAACYIAASVANYAGEVSVHVRDGMSRVIVSVGPHHTLREAARQMSERNVGAAVVLDPDAPGPGIITERDILLAVGEGQDIDAERVGDHLTAGVVYATPDWSLEEAAVAMVRGGFRHLVVCEGSDTIGVLSVRDVVRVWTADGSICEVPESPVMRAA